MSKVIRLWIITAMASPLFLTLLHNAGVSGWNGIVFGAVLGTGFSTAICYGEKQ